MLIRQFLLASLLTLPLTSWSQTASFALKKCVEHYQQNHFDQALVACEKAAKKDNPTAQYLLALMYQAGKGVKPDSRQATAWFNSAALNGDAASQLKMAKKHSTEILTNPDYVKAVQYYTNAALQNNAEAQFFLALCHQLGLGVPEDYTAALYWYHQAIKNGLPEGLPIPTERTRDKDIAYSTTKTGAQKAFLWANQKKHKDGSLVSSEEKLNRLSIAAEKGSAAGQYQLGMHYAEGDITTQNDAKALYWFSKAAAQNHQQAQLQLAWMTALGLGTRAHLGEAVKYFIQARQTTAIQEAQQEHYQLSPHEILTRYQHALELVERPTTDQDEEIGIKIIQKIAQQDFLAAQVYLAKAYQAGQILPQDTTLAAQWYQKAAKQGHIGSQYALGWLYFYGDGVPKNYQLAYQYFDQAGKQGDRNAKNARAFVLSAINNSLDFVAAR